MGEYLWAGKPSHLATEVDSAFYPPWNSKIMIGNGGYGLLAAYGQAGGSSQLDWSKGWRPPGAVSVFNV